MYFTAVISDQLYTWSDENPEPVHCRIAKTPQRFLRQLPPLQSILRGSLIESYKRCGKPGCKCADGPGHGPKYYLSVSYPGLRPQMDYVPQELHAQTAELLANYHRARRFSRQSARSTANYFAAARRSRS